MSKQIIGIHIGHDASACLIDEFGIIIHLREEQITGIKHFNGFPRRAVSEIARRVERDQLFAVAFSTIGPLFDRTDESFVIDIDAQTHAYGEYYDRLPDRLADRHISLTHTYARFEDRLHFSEESKTILADFLSDRNIKVFYVHHHLAHASCFRVFPGLYNKLITADGRGDGVSSTIYSVLSNAPRLVSVRGTDSSLGALYQCATEVAGYLGVDSEYKIMGLSAFGGVNVDWARQLKSWLGSVEGWSWIPYSQQYPGRSVNNPLNAIIPPRHIREAYQSLTKEDFAATIQAVFEDEMIRLVSSNLEVGDSVFCAGGLFLNSKCNQKLQSHFSGVRFAFFPDSGDSGLAIGCAAAVGKLVTTAPFSIQLGQEDGFERLGRVTALSGHPYEKAELRLSEVCRAMLRGEVVGICDGRSEIGPRALGARSIIADAFNPDLRHVLNQRKKREPFVPIAPSVLKSDAEKLMHIDGDEYFMLKTVKAKKIMKELTPALVHKDGSTRPQIVDDDETSLLAQVLRHIKQEKGFGIVANTSLNRSGYPTAGDIEEALQCLSEGVIDILINRDNMIRKSRNIVLRSEQI